MSLYNFPYSCLESQHHLQHSNSTSSPHLSSSRRSGSSSQPKTTLAVLSFCMPTYGAVHTPTGSVPICAHSKGQCDKITRNVSFPVRNTHERVYRHLILTHPFSCPSTHGVSCAKCNVSSLTLLSPLAIHIPARTSTSHRLARKQTSTLRYRTRNHSNV